MCRTRSSKTEKMKWYDKIGSIEQKMSAQTEEKMKRIENLWLMMDGIHSQTNEKNRSLFMGDDALSRPTTVQGTFKENFFYKPSDQNVLKVLLK